MYFDDQEPLYRIQRMAVDEALQQGLVNFFRRLIRLPIKQTMQEVELNFLKKYNLDETFLTLK